MRGVVLKANLTACSMLNVPREALEQAAFAEFIAPADQDSYHLCQRSVLNTGQHKACELTLHRTGGDFAAQLNLELCDPDMQLLQISITDISLIKETAASLQRALDREKAISELRARVLSVIEHEFRTPFAIILSAIETLESYGDRLAEQDRHKRYQSIRSIVWYLNNMVQDAASIQDIDTALYLKLTTFDAVAFIRQAISGMEDPASDLHRIVLEVVSQNDAEAVTWDQNLIRRILMNLLKNALRYSQEPIQCRLNFASDSVQISVADRGIGISDLDQQHMFEAFYRGDNTAFIHGLGIGLFVVQHAVQAHGGTIRCESRLGEGTIFTVELPRHALHRAEQAAISPQAPLSP